MSTCLFATPPLLELLLACYAFAVIGPFQSETIRFRTRYFGVDAGWSSCVAMVMIEEHCPKVNALEGNRTLAGCVFVANPTARTFLGFRVYCCDTQATLGAPGADCASGSVRRVRVSTAQPPVATATQRVTQRVGNLPDLRATQPMTYPL